MTLPQWIPQLKWIDVGPEDAMAMGLEQALRWRWQMLSIMWFGWGIGFCLRAQVPK